MQPPNFPERYRFVATLLQRRRAYLAVAVMRLGQVHFTAEVETAAIHASGDTVKLYFNPDFFDAIDNFELAGVLVHEGLHFALRHQQRAEKICRQSDRFLFNVACDAVINDMITAAFPELKLPGEPVTGQKLLNCDASTKSAEEVFQMLRGRQTGTDGESLNRVLNQAQTVDDHSLWAPASDVPQAQPKPEAGWSNATMMILKSLSQGVAGSDPAFGLIALAADRLAPPDRNCRKYLARLLTETLRSGQHCEVNWSQPNRRLTAVYPRVILPVYEASDHWDVLIAIDSSGSVRDGFLAAALTIARQRIPRTIVSLISFDAESYEVQPASTQVKGGGGTRAQAVEEYARKKTKHYPDTVFILTDGYTPPPTLLHPERWVWILPPWGATTAIPKGCRTEFFAPPGSDGEGNP